MSSSLIIELANQTRQRAMEVATGQRDGTPEGIIKSAENLLVIAVTNGPIKPFEGVMVRSAVNAMILYAEVAEDAWKDNVYG